MGARCRTTTLFALLAVAAACGVNSGDNERAEIAPPSPSDQSATIPVLVDTDMGFDDVRALMLLATDPQIDLRAVTVAGNGLARCPTGAHNASAILRLLDHPDVPVACGSNGPVDGSNLAPTTWRDAADGLAGMNLTEAPIADEDAATLLINTIDGAETPVTLLTLGPLTNIAEALEIQPDLLDNVDEVLMMGGAFDVGGNTLSFRARPVAEFNIWFDPVAAARVFETNVPLTIVPLDATNDVPVTPLLHDVVLDAGDDAPPATVLLRDHLRSSPFVGGAYHWDDLAAASLTNPDLLTTETASVSVVTGDGDDAGQTIRDPDGRPATIAIGADRLAFESQFGSAFGLLPFDSSTYTADAIVVFDGEECRYDGPDDVPADLTIEITNSSSRSALGVSAGVYTPGTTREQLEQYWATNPTTPPGFLSMHAIAPLPAATTSYWRFENPPNSTLSCAYDLTSGTELAGPRLPDAPD